MRVLHVAAVDPCVTRPGGTRTYVLSLISELRRQGVDARLVGASYSGGKPGFPFMPIRLRRASSASFWAKLALRALSMRLSPRTVLHFHRPEDALPFIAFHPCNRKVITLHGVPSKGVSQRNGALVGWLYSRAEAYALARADAVVAVSEEAAAHCRRASGRRASVVPVGVDTGLFRRAEGAKERLGLSGKVALFVGRFEAEKGTADFASLVGKVGASLVAVGSGPLEGELSSAGVSVETGVEHSRMPERYSAADVLVLPSRYEGLPTVVLEALACGTPVVAYDVGDVRKVVDDTVGRVSSPGRLAEDVSAVLASPPSPASCRRRAEAFSIQRVAASVMRIYGGGT